jgi:hypothetical protein
MSMSRQFFRISLKIGCKNPDLIKIIQLFWKVTGMVK